MQFSDLWVLYRPQAQDLLSSGCLSLGIVPQKQSISGVREECANALQVLSGHFCHHFDHLDNPEHRFNAIFRPLGTLQASGARFALLWLLVPRNSPSKTVDFWCQGGVRQCFASTFRPFLSPV
jgi:hypothetical protein